MCECDDGRCMMVLRLAASAYDEVRRDPRQFVVLSGHASPPDEIVERGEGYVIVRKRDGRE